MRQETLTILSCQEFDQLVHEHLGVELQHYVQGEGFIGYDFQQNLPIPESWQSEYSPEPYANDSTVDFTYSDLVQFSQEDRVFLNDKYALELFEKGIFPKEYRVQVEVSW